MGYLLADRRDRGLLVSAAESGYRVSTRDPWRARHFANPDLAREWADRNLLGIEVAELVLLNARPILKSSAPKQKSPGEGSAGLNKGISTHDHSEIYERPAQP